MRSIGILPAALLVLGLGACEGDLLDVRPVDEIDEEIAITDAASAQAALNGAYAGLFGHFPLTSGFGTNYYAGDYVIFGDLMSDNAEHEGTFDTYAQAGRNSLLAESITLDRIWAVIYDGINRANILIQKVPTLDASVISETEADQILAEAYALRALHYHNLVRAWGGVPLVLVPPEDLDEAALVERATVAEVYTQILSDLDEAEGRFGFAGANNLDRTLATPGFVDALQARVNLYQENWTAAQSNAMEVVNSGDYALVETFGTLFPDDEGATSEDILSVGFTADAYNNFGFYYQYAGRFEVGATQDIYNAYPDGDERWAWNFGATDVDEVEVTKFPTTIGAENVHVIRYAEVLLTLAEALARQGGAGNLATAVEYLNMVRTRADVAGYDLAADLNNDQQEVLEAIWLERRLELAFEGDRWFDLVRTGRAVSMIPTLTDPNYTLWPIPQGELDVAPNLTQNPGY